MTAQDRADRTLVDPERLARWMDARDLPGRGEPITTRFITGGASNELFEIRRGDARLALRRPPAKVPEGRNESMLREYRVLAALRDTDVPHARVLAACDDPSVLGACFYLMSYVDGWSCMSTNGWPAPFDTDLDARRELAWELVDAIAKLARVDWRARGLEGFGKPEGFHERQVDRWLAHLARFRCRDIPGLDDAAAWLRRYRPRSYRPGIIHGDYQFANVMYRHGAPARLAAIVDWEMATIGDPLLDLGWVLATWPEGDSESTVAVSPWIGFPAADELIERYRAGSERDLSATEWYLALACYKLGILLEGTYARACAGKAPRDVGERLHGRAVVLLERAGRLTR